MEHLSRITRDEINEIKVILFDLDGTLLVTIGLNHPHLHVWKN